MSRDEGDEVSNLGGTCIGGKDSSILYRRGDWRLGGNSYLGGIG